MKVVILAGGLGTRLSEETSIKPKPMVEIGGLPILWHILKIYSYYGFNDFIICLGYHCPIFERYSQQTLQTISVLWRCNRPNFEGYSQQVLLQESSSTCCNHPNFEGYSQLFDYYITNI